MERTRVARDGSATVAPAVSADGIDTGIDSMIDTDTSTTMLRRCTALATRARVDLLSPGRGGAAEELVALLAEMASWDTAHLEAPDPTMTVLAAAALQDLVERLQIAEGPPEPTSSALITSADAVLTVLRGLMAGGRIDVPA